MKNDITKPTIIYGASDDLVEMEGGYDGEAGCYNTSEESPCVVFVSDGTVLSVIYAPADRAIWKIQLIEKGVLFNRIDLCTDEDAKPYSDVAHFDAGITWVYAFKVDEPVKRVS